MNTDSSRAGQWYNGQGYVGVSSELWHPDRFPAELADPGRCLRLRSAELFLRLLTNRLSGNNLRRRQYENCRHSTSLKYRINVGHFRAAALWQFGGYGQNNASNGAYQFQAGADIPTLGKGVLSFDAIYSYVRDSVSLALGPGSNDANGVPIPPFLPQTLTATISDNSAVMLVAKYAIGPLKLYGGYERITYMAPSDPQAAFTDFAGSFLCQGCAAINNTDIINTAFGVGGFGNKIFQVIWTSAKYSLTDKLDVIAAYYHYSQNSFFGTPTGGPAPCSGSEHAQCAGTFNAISGVIDWRFAPKWDLYAGLMFSKENSGLANGFLERNNIDPTVGLRFRF